MIDWPEAYSHTYIYTRSLRSHKDTTGERRKKIQINDRNERKRDLETKSHCRFGWKAEWNFFSVTVASTQRHPVIANATHTLRDQSEKRREWFKRTPIFQISDPKRNVRGKYKRKLGFGRNIIDLSADIWRCLAFLTHTHPLKWLFFSFRQGCLH